jgi:hypothetical protein
VYELNLFNEYVISSSFFSFCWGRRGWCLDMMTYFNSCLNVWSLNMGTQPYLCSLLESLQKKKKRGAPLDDEGTWVVPFNTLFFFFFFPSNFEFRLVVYIYIYIYIYKDDFQIHCLILVCVINQYAGSYWKYSKWNYLCWIKSKNNWSSSESLVGRKFISLFLSRED